MLSVQLFQWSYQWVSGWLGVMGGKEWRGTPKKGHPMWSEEQEERHIRPKSVMLQLKWIIRGKDFLPKGSHGWALSRPGNILWPRTRVSQVALVIKNLPANAGAIWEASVIPGSGRLPGGGNGNPLQYSCLKNPMNRGAWQATVHGVVKSWTWMKQLSMLTHILPSYIFLLNLKRLLLLLLKNNWKHKNYIWGNWHSC